MLVVVEDEGARHFHHAPAQRGVHLLGDVHREDLQAIAHIRRWESGEPWPVVILLDINLPKINGLEVLRELKTHPLLQRIPVIVLTSSGEDRDIQKAYELGANSYIVKPVDFEKFVEVAAQIDLYWNVINIPPR